MKVDHPHKLKLQSLFAKITIVLGLALLTFMIIVEDEPGAIPLFLIIAGTAWHLLIRRKIRSLS